MSQLFRLLLFVCSVITFNIHGFDCAKQKNSSRPMSVHREDPYRFLTFSSDGITLSSVIGFSDVNKLVPGGIERETESVFQHAQTILERNGSSLDQVFLVQINLADKNDTQIVDEIFKKYFREPYPEKRITEVARLPLNAKIEADISATMTLDQLFQNQDTDDD